MRPNGGWKHYKNQNNHTKPRQTVICRGFVMLYADYLPQEGGSSVAHSVSG